MTTVIKIGGSICDDPDALSALAELCQTATGPTIILHGGGPQLDTALAALGPPERINGLRVTTPDAAAAMAAVFDEIGQRVATHLHAAGIHASHVPAGAKPIKAEALTIPGLGRVGQPVDVALDLDADVVVMGPLGADHEGPLNINADTAASAVALAVGASALLLATDVPHVIGAGGDRVTVTDVAGAHALIADGTAKGGMIPKLQAAAGAVVAGIDKVVIGDLRATQQGGGTTVTGAVAA